MPDYPFESDGCTMSPDGFWQVNYRDCCVEHDKDYWMGGTLEQRKASDQRLRDCIDEACLQKRWSMRSAWFVSRIYYIGVRAFGRLPIRRARWGFGWPYPRTGP